MKTFKDFLAEAITRRRGGRLNVGRSAEQQHAIKDTGLSRQGHKDEIADIEAFMKEYPEEQHPTLHQGWGDTIKYHKDALAKLK